MTSQRKCITSFNEKVLSKEETGYFIRCAENLMLLDNSSYQIYTASLIAATEGKMHKASINMSSLLENVTYPYLN